jgi:hypothetical protein
MRNLSVLFCLARFEFWIPIVCQLQLRWHLTVEVRDQNTNQTQHVFSLTENALSELLRGD